MKSGRGPPKATDPMDNGAEFIAESRMTEAR
jgi:hypothetical protein